jgi:hypothetical protein
MTGYLTSAASRFRPKTTPWHNDPVLFARTCVKFPPGAQLAGYQADVLAHLASHRRVAQRGPHGNGKTAVN